MTMIVDERYKRLTRQLKPACWAGIKYIAVRQQMTISAVIKENPQLIPKRLRALAASCFVETRRECIEARLVELLKIQRELVRELDRLPNI